MPPALLLLAHLAVAETGSPSSTGVFANHQLPSGAGLYVRWDPERSWGASLVVDTLADVSERLAFLLPQADPIMIGDMSRQGGGQLFGHTTHDVGLDVDIGLYLSGARQPFGGFVDVPPEQLDLAATWVLVRTLLNTGRVAYILLDQRHIRALRAHLLDELEMPRDLVDAIFPADGARPELEATRVRGIVRHAPNHRSHLHVRFTTKEE